MKSNKLLFILLLITFQSNAQNMKKHFKAEVKEGIARTSIIEKEIISENDLEHLPEIVQSYLKYVGVVGTEKVTNFKVSMLGGIKMKPEDDWMKCTVQQYSFIDQPTRAFYIKAKKMGLSALGLHLYKNEVAFMVVKMLGLFKVVDARGPEMNQSETVTMFNDMCIMAPATLIDKSIKWEVIDSLKVKAFYTNKNITISAELIFNENGQLINFISNDRYEQKEGTEFTNFPWSTPIGDYKNINGFMLPTSGFAIYHRPEGEFAYIKLEILDVLYNVSD
jgi:hypothetical protein